MATQTGKERPLAWLAVPEERELPEEVRRLFAAAEEKLGFVPNVFRALALRPTHLLKWRDYFDELVFGEDSGLTVAQRELIAVAVSARNRCHYCLTSHGAGLRVLTGNPILAEQVAHNSRHAELSSKERAMVDFAVKMTDQSSECGPEDVAALREVGWSDEEILDLAQVAAMFNFTNRLANAFGWVPNEEYHALGR